MSGMLRRFFEEVTQALCLCSCDLAMSDGRGWVLTTVVLCRTRNYPPRTLLCPRALLRGAFGLGWVDQDGHCSFYRAMEGNVLTDQHFLLQN